MHNTIKNLSEINLKNKLALYGAGSFGKYVYEKIQDEIPNLAVECFIDDQKKGNFCGLPIYDFSTFLSKYNNVDVLITSSYWKNILKKVSQTNLKYFVADILNKEIENKFTPKLIDGVSYDFYTPNQFLFEVVKRLETTEPKTYEWVKTLDNKVFVDIGASCGVYSILAGIQNNTIISIEPDALNFSILKRNIFLNNNKLKGRFFPFNIALSANKKILIFNILEYGEGFHGKFTSNSDRSQSDNSYSENIMAYPLDGLINDFNIEFPTHIKIDVDGAEFDVLKGMSAVLNSHSLIQILIEINNSDEENLIMFLNNYGFNLKERHAIREITGMEITGINNLLFSRNG